MGTSECGPSPDIRLSPFACSRVPVSTAVVPDSAPDPTDQGEVWRSGVLPPHVAEPRILPELTLPLPDGARLVTVEAPYGREVVVEGSEDLVTWQEIGRDPCERGEFEVYHEAAGAGAPWFYRARQVEP